MKKLTDMRTDAGPNRSMGLVATLHWTVAVLILVAAVGCGDGRPKRVPVSGQVLVDGKPVKGGSIQFIPEGSRASSSDLDEDGRFSLRCFEKDDGAVTGTHRVKVAARAMEGGKLRWYAPEKYADIDLADITVEIEEPTDSLLIELTWKGSKKPR